MKDFIIPWDETDRGTPAASGAPGGSSVVSSPQRRRTRCTKRLWSARAVRGGRAAAISNGGAKPLC